MMLLRSLSRLGNPVYGEGVCLIRNDTFFALENVEEVAWRCLHLASECAFKDRFKSALNRTTFAVMMSDAKNDYRMQAFSPNILTVLFSTEDGRRCLD